MIFYRKLFKSVVVTATTGETMKIWKISLIILILTLQVTAGAYIEGGPEFRVSVAGSNHFSPGDEGYITVTLQNIGILDTLFEPNPAKFAIFQNMSTTAFEVKVGLSGVDGIDVKSPPQIIGIVPSGTPPIPVTFRIHIDENIQPGEYQIPVKITYKKLRDVVLFYQDSYLIETKYYWDDEIKTLYIPVVIEKKLDISVKEIKTRDVFEGHKGWIGVSILNTGTETAKNAVAILTQISQSKGIQASGLPGITQIPSSLPQGMIPPQTQQISPPEKQGGDQLSAFIGDLPPGKTAVARFRVKLDTSGDQYPFGLKLKYFDESGKEKESKTVYFGIKVDKGPEISVSDVESGLYSGSEGVVKITLRNTWDRDMKDAVVSIKTSSPLTSLTSSVYTGDIPSGASRVVEFKLKASDDAQPSVYPAEVRVKFSYGNETLTTDPVTFGVDVGKKMEFSAKSNAEIEAGRESIVQVEVKNSGAYPIRDASARLTVVDPFTSTDDTAFLGDLAPGESKIASFKLKVDSDAIPKVYALNLEVKYRDTQNKWVISDPVKVPVKVVEGKKRVPGFETAGAIIGFAAVLILLRRKA